ncbi:MAG: outer membrane protein assembly factor BamE [Pseudomonadota bacterium]
MRHGPFAATPRAARSRLSIRLAGLRSLGACVAVAAALAACSPIKKTHGYTPREAELEGVRVGADTRESVMQKIGRPSTLGTFDAKEWYYISQQTEAFAFYEPEIVDRTVVTVSFDEDGLVSEVGRYGLEDGKVIDLVTRTTPTAGRRLTILQQIFANVGRFNPGSQADGPIPGR